MSGARILVVDDDESIRSTLAQHLAVHGFDIVHAGDGAAGVARRLERETSLVTSSGPERRRPASSTCVSSGIHDSMGMTFGSWPAVWRPWPTRSGCWITSRSSARTSSVRRWAG